MTAMSDHQPDYIGHDLNGPDGAVIHQEIRCGARGVDPAGEHTCTRRPGHDGPHQEGAWQFTAARIGFTVRSEPGRVVIDSVDGDGLHRSFLLAPDQAMELSYELFCTATEQGAMPWLPSGGNAPASPARG